MKKVVIIVVVGLVLLPLLPKIIPKSFTMESVEPGFRTAGFTVEGARPVEPPQNEALEQLSMTVNGLQVDVFRYDDEGKIAKQLEFQKPDSGSAIVEAWGLAQTLGAAKPVNKPVTPERRGMFMIVVTGDDKALRLRIAESFKHL